MKYMCYDHSLIGKGVCPLRQRSHLNSHLVLYTTELVTVSRLKAGAPYINDLVTVEERIWANAADQSTANSGPLLIFLPGRNSPANFNVVKIDNYKI